MDTLDRPDTSGPVVNIGDLQRKRLSEALEWAMQGAYGHPDLTDPSQVQVAVAGLLERLAVKSDLDSWPAIAIALVRVASVLKKTPLPLAEAVAEARKVAGV
jgi:hypothetical protein